MTMSRGSTSGSSARASDRTKPTVNSFKPDYKEFDRIEYIKRFTFAGEFWDPSNRLTAELLELIKAVSVAQVNWNDVIPRVEEVMLKIENEIDQAERDEVTRYRDGSDGGDM